MGPARKYLTGRFGRLTIMWPAGCDRKDTWYLCLCDCGVILPVRQSNFTRKNTRRTYSCGCWGREKDVTHGACVGGKSPEYLAYLRAKGRCTNPRRSNYKYYGGANPPVLFKFKSFEEWYAELGPRPGSGYTPDRINPWGHYEKGNLKWATWMEQSRNKRRTCPNRA